jgi:uncharacterized membrane protein YeaQ/YmgE (transglycosylase-associated protein family)
MVEIITAIVMGIVAGLLVKYLFLKESNLTWVAVFGVVGAVIAYFLYTSLTADVTKAVFTLGAAVVIAGILHMLWSRLGKAA